VKNVGAADDIKQGLTKSLATFTAQRKAEEKQSYAVRYRTSRMMGVRSERHTAIAFRLMKQCYLKVSDNNKLPALVRQIFYVLRPLIEKETDRPLSYHHFSQTILPNYINKHVVECAKWDVVYDDRGHFIEPHTGRMIGLGTLSVRAYLNRIKPLQLKEADFASAFVETYGPSGSFGALLYVEKEGFMPLFARVTLAERYDIAIMSSKGTSVIAARQLAEGICSRYNIPLLVLHDFDRPGIIIRDTLENSTRRHKYARPPKVIDLGLSYDDIDDLTPEKHESAISDARLEKAGLDDDAIAFLSDQRVELNAMTSRQLIDFVEGKLIEHGIGKVIPDAETLAKTYKMFVASNRLAEEFEELKEKLEDESEDQEAPEDLEAKVKDKLREKPEITWHRAVQLIIDPDAPDDDDDDGGDKGGDGGKHKDGESQTIDVNKLAASVLGDDMTTIRNIGESVAKARTDANKLTNDIASVLDDDDEDEIDDEDLSDIEE
jgi:hypothetical protein